MLETINIFGLKLSFIEDKLSKIDAEIAEKHFKENVWSIKQHVYIMSYWLSIGIEYIESMDKGKPDSSFFNNIDAVSEKIAQQSESVKYKDAVKQYKERSEKLILKFKNSKTKNLIQLMEFLMNQAFFFFRHFGMIEEKVKILSIYSDILL